MTYGDILCEALRLMGVQGIQNADSTVTSQGKDYLCLIPGSINRCFADLENRSVLPQKMFLLDRSLALNENGILIFDLSPLCISELIRVVATSENGYIPSFDFALEGDSSLVIFDTNPEFEYKLIYRQMIARVCDSTANDFPLSLPERIASLIPYYVAGDIYMGDEPQLAATYRNMYESGILTLHDMQSGNTGFVKADYSQT